jgi:Domain of unknown function (DUF4259)
MPGWGTGNFENEDAQNFVSRLDSVGVADLRQMLSHAAGRDYLEGRISGAVVAAAEVVAALVSSANDETSLPGTPQQILDWVSNNNAAIPADLVDIARRAVEKVRTHSELKDLWFEAEGLNEWSQALRGLEARLSEHIGLSSDRIIE